MIKIRMKQDETYSLDGINVTSFLKGQEYDVPQNVFEYFYALNAAVKVNPTIDTPTNEVILQDKAVKSAPKTKKNKDD